MASKAKAKKTEHYTLLKAIYVVFLGLIIALFCGLGVAAFYQQPKEPKPPVASASENANKTGPSQAEIGRAHV